MLTHLAPKQTGSPKGIRKHEWLVGKVLRRVILYAPEPILHQKWTEHRRVFATVELELLAILRTDFTFEPPTLDNFLWRTSLDR